MHLRPILRNPLAVLPLALSLAAFAVVVGYLLLHGTKPPRDENAAAHVFQLLIVAELPIVAIFLSRWLRRAPRFALSTFALQVGAMVIAFAPVLYFDL